MKQIKYFRTKDKNNHYIPKGVLEMEYNEKRMSLNLGWSICVKADCFSKKKAKKLADLRLESGRYSIDLSNQNIGLDYPELIKGRLETLYKKKRLFSAGREISNKKYNTWSVTTKNSSNYNTSVEYSFTNMPKNDFLKIESAENKNLFHDFITFAVLKFVERFQKEN